MWNIISKGYYHYFIIKLCKEYEETFSTKSSHTQNKTEITDLFFRFHLLWKLFLLSLLHFGSFSLIVVDRLNEKYFVEQIFWKLILEYWSKLFEGSGSQPAQWHFGESPQAQLYLHVWRSIWSWRHPTPLHKGRPPCSLQADCLHHWPGYRTWPGKKVL